MGNVSRGKYAQADRDRMAKSGEAMPDGSYPIANREDLQNAIHAVGRGSGSHDAIRAHIIKRAKALGLSSMIPADWGSGGSMSRTAPLMLERSYILSDISIQRGGDGRTVEAYAAVFDQEAEIRDHQGHYVELIDQHAFNQRLSAMRSPQDVKVFYNHGRDLYGNPTSEGAKPIGVPVDIRPDGKGLVTVTRYSATPLGDEVLELIRDGAITGQSFTGRIVRSDPDRRLYKATPRGQLTTVRRLELGLAEYGPTPMPAYEGAGILALRNLPSNLPGPTPDDSKHSARVQELQKRTKEQFK